MRCTTFDRLEKYDINDNCSVWNVPFDKLRQRELLKYPNLKIISYGITTKKISNTDELNEWIEKIDLDVLFMPNLLSVNIEDEIRYVKERLSTNKYRYFIKDDTMIIPVLDSSYIEIPNTIKHLRIWRLCDYLYLNNLPIELQSIRISELPIFLDTNAINLPINLLKLEIFYNDKDNDIDDLENKIKRPFGCEFILNKYPTVDFNTYIY